MLVGLCGRVLVEGEREGDGFLLYLGGENSCFTADAMAGKQARGLGQNVYELYNSNISLEMTILPFFHDNFPLSLYFFNN